MSETVTKQRIAIALWAYAAQEDNELSFEAGDRIVITEMCNDDWYEGTLATATGFFPANHVKVLPEVLQQSADTLKSGTPSVSVDLLQRSQESSQSGSSPLLSYKDDTTDSRPSGTLRESSSVMSRSSTAGRASTIDTDQGYARSSMGDNWEGGHNSGTAGTEIDEFEDRSAGDLGSEDQLAEDGWHVVTTEDGQIYYWNSKTNETSWKQPYSETPLGSLDNLAIEDEDGSPRRHLMKQESKSMDAANITGTTTHSASSRNLMKASGQLTQIETVPPELIRREGWLSYKARKEFGGVEPKRAHSWHNHWAIVCVGYLIFYKDEPAKLKKKSDKTPIAPSLVITLSSIQISREKDAKKKTFSIQTLSGAVWGIMVPNETEINEWMTIISESTKEASTPTEYENATSKLYSKQSPSSDTFDDSPTKKKDEKKFGWAEGRKKDRSVSTATEPGEDVEAIINSKTNIKSKLNAFFKRQQEKLGSAISEKENTKEADKALPISDESIFGGLLEAQYASENGIPTFVVKCITAINERGLESQGIYRLSGNAATIQRIKALVNQKNLSELDDESLDLNVVSGLLKLYFRELKNPLIPFDFYDRFIACMKIDDYNERLIEIKNLVQTLPKIHYDVLEFLMRHLVVVASHSAVNKMEPSNLAIVFGPTIIRVHATGNDDMQAAYANMMNMSFQNAD
eukprot:jgi/Hompol1/3688/HPOL_001664-RA